MKGSEKIHAAPTVLGAAGQSTRSRPERPGAAGRLAACIVFCFSLVFLARSTFAEPNSLGMNLDAPLDWLPQRMFADAMKSSRTMRRIGSTSSDPVDVALDARGFPREDFEVGFWFDAERMDGSYRLSFSGRADVAVWPRGELRGLAHDPASNTTTGTLVVTDRGKGALVLRFTNTRRGPRSNTPDGLTDIKLMRPIAEGSARSYQPGRLLTEQFARALAPFSVLRYNGFVAGDYGSVVAWKDRPLPGPSLNRPAAHCAADDNCWQGQGGPWEYVILVSNALHKDAWITIPMHVDEDYLRQLALLFRDGNAFTGGKGLDRSLHLYLEYSNEMWNWGYRHTHENSELAKAELAAGDPYHYGPAAPGYNPWMLRVARRAVEIGRVFRAVFGDAAMMTRVRPVFTWQSVNLETGLEPLIYLEDRYIPACVAGTLPGGAPLPRCPPRTKVSDLLYGSGGSAYYYTEEDRTGITLDNIWQSGTMDPARWGETHQIANVAIAATFGLKRVAYEGGPHFNLLLAQDAQGQRFTADKPGCPSDVARMAAWSDIRMKESVLGHHAAWSRWGGDLLVYSGFAGGNEFGFIHDVLDVDAPDMNAASPKMSALIALAAQPRVPLAYGNPVGSAVSGKAFDLGFRSWYRPGKGDLRIADGEWSSYLFNTAADGEYAVAASVADADARSTIVAVDGGPLVTSAHDGVVGGHVTLARGLHAVRVRASGGAIVLKSLSLAQRR